MNENLEQQAHALFKAWFVDFEPFGGVMPYDWNVGIVSDLSKEIICGKTPSTKKKEYYGNFMPFITIPDMHNCVYAISTERYLSELGAKSQSKKTLPKNSICVSCIGTAGLVVLVAVDSQTNQQINSIIPKDGYSPYYIYLFMQTLSEKINRLGQSGSTIVNLNKAQFGIMEALVPSIVSMNEFDSIVQPLFKLILANQQENQRLSAIRDTLLPKLMNGEIDVSAVKI
ncbi:MAG: restriction endonuclease subunit S [Ruminococcus sp. 37_24]|nr:MAG: restriction endonuclease subunit S [Ruminococcus sp. 37_24]